MHERGEGVGAIQRCSSCGLLNEAGRETCLGCGVTLPLTPPHRHRAAPAPNAPPQQPTPTGEIPDAALVPATIVMPGRESVGPPSDYPPRTPAAQAKGALSSTYAQVVTPAIRPQLSHSAAKRRRRLLSLILFVIAACCAGGAYILYRSSSDSPTTTTLEALPAPTATRSGAVAQAQKALRDFFGPSYIGSEPNGRSATYPGIPATLDQWRVKTPDGPYAAWITTTSEPVVTRVEASGPLEKKARLAAQETADSARWYERRTLGLSQLFPSPRSILCPEGGTQLNYVWQLQKRGSGAGDGGEVLLPTWVSVWIDEKTGKLLKYDSLTMSVDPDVQAQVLDATAPDIAGESGAEAVLIVAPLWIGDRWEQTLVWRVTRNPQGARADSDYVFIIAADENTATEVAIDELYVPRLESLPAFREVVLPTSPPSGGSPGPDESQFP